MLETADDVCVVGEVLANVKLNTGDSLRGYPHR